MPQRRPSELDREFGEFLRKVMKEYEWSYPQLSKKSGVPISMIHGLVAGTQSTSLHMLYRVLSNLGLGLRDIFPQRIETPRKTR